MLGSKDPSQLHARNADPMCGRLQQALPVHNAQYADCRPPPMGMPPIKFSIRLCMGRMAAWPGTIPVALVVPPLSIPIWLSIPSAMPLCTCPQALVAALRLPATWPWQCGLLCALCITERPNLLCRLRLTMQ